MLTVVEPYEPPIPPQGNPPAKRYKPIDLKFLIRHTRRVHMTVAIFSKYYTSFIQIVGSLRYQEIISGRDFDQSRHLLRGFHPAFLIRILSYLRLLEPHHGVDNPWNLKTVVNTAKALLRLADMDDFELAQPGDGTFYSGEHSLFCFLTHYSSAEDIDERSALRNAMDSYILEEIALGRYDNVAEDEEAAYQLLRKLHSMEYYKTEATGQLPTTAVTRSIIYYSPSQKRNSLDSTSCVAQALTNTQDAAPATNTSLGLVNLMRNPRTYIKPKMPMRAYSKSTSHVHHAPLTNREPRTVLFRNPNPICRPDECSFCSEHDAHKVVNCPIAEDYIARGLCFRDPIYHRLNFPDGTRLTRQAPGANFRTSLDMWYARQNAEQRDTAVIAPRTALIPHKIDGEREESFDRERGTAEGMNFPVNTGAAANKVSTSTTSCLATEVPVVHSLGMSIVGTYYK